MKSLETLIKTYTQFDVSLGADEDDGDNKNVQSIDKKNLRKDLEVVKSANKQYFLICVIMIIVLFIASLILVLINLAKPNIVTAIMTAFGISTAGLILLMIKLWREKSNTELLLALALNMDGETLKRIIEILAARLPA